jgi:toxin FitB
VGFLLDTNVISETRKPKPSPRVMAWMESIPRNSLYLSVMVIGEIRAGIGRVARRDHPQAAAIAAWAEELREEYGDRILPVTVDVAEEWAKLTVPDKLPVIDGLMAATANVHRLTFVTRNVRDIVRSNVPVLNPFDG